MGIDGDVEAVGIEASRCVLVVGRSVLHEELPALGAAGIVQPDGAIDAARFEVLTGAVDDFEGSAVLLLLDGGVACGLLDTLAAFTAECGGSRGENGLAEDG